MLRVIRFFRGYVRVRVDGFAPQRFLNLCSVHGIELWDIVSEGYLYEMNLSISDFFRLKPIIRKTRTKVVLLSRRGLPFRLKKWKKRKVFIGCSLICAISLYLVSLFVWDIELAGEGQLTKDMLLQFLQENGVTYGSYIPGIEIDEVEKKLRDEYPFILWTSFHLEGTRLYIEVKENSQGLQPDMTEGEEGPCDLRATVSGTVKSIVTRSGIPQVKAGDKIEKGDVLVRGQIAVYNDDETLKEYMYVHSDADIRMETRLPYEKELKYQYQKKVYTGERKTAYYFRLHTKGFSTAGIPDYESYDIVTDLKQAKLLNDFYLPLYYGKIVYQEYRLGEFVYSEKECETLLKHEFEKFCETLQQKGVQIVEKDVKIEKNEYGQKAKGTITVEMSDGEEQEITEIQVPEIHTDTGETQE